MNDKRYEVHTHWGWFRLDAGAYQDYLAGSLWISWKPGDLIGESLRTRRAPAPLVISPSADNLRRRANRIEFFKLLFMSCRSDDIPIPFLVRMEDIPIEELNLSVHSYSCLQRSGITDFGGLWEMIRSSRFQSIMGLEKACEAEIMRQFLSACYGRLTSQEQGLFWQKVIECSEKDGNKWNELPFQPTFLPVEIDPVIIENINRNRW